MSIKNFIRIMCGFNNIVDETTKLLIKKTIDVINTKVLKENYVTREEFEILKKSLTATTSAEEKNGAKKQH